MENDEEKNVGRRVRRAPGKNIIFRVTEEICGPNKKSETFSEHFRLLDVYSPGKLQGTPQSWKYFSHVNENEWTIRLASDRFLTNVN